MTMTILTAKMEQNKPILTDKLEQDNDYINSENRAKQ